jgi:hypothetical protein
VTIPPEGFVWHVPREVFLFHDPIIYVSHDQTWHTRDQYIERFGIDPEVAMNYRRREAVKKLRHIKSLHKSEE